MECSKCLEKSIVFRRDSNTHLCESHFVDAFEETVKHTIEDNNMIVEGDRIAVALSGGKDSTALIYVLNKILSKRKNISVFAITIDEGIKGYREDTIKSARNISEKLRDLA
jgi:tRNA(Ile)-lysidine synthase TilS/MesJ